MAKPNASLRPFHFDQGVLKVLLADDSWRNVRVADGGPATLPSGKHVQSCIVFDYGCGLLLLHRDDGASAVWVLDAEMIVVSDLMDSAAAMSPDLRRFLSDAATPFMDDLRRNPVAPSPDPVWDALRKMGLGPLSAFAALAHTELRVTHAAAATASPLKVNRGITSVALSDIGQLLTRFPTDSLPRTHPWLVSAARAGRIAVPALSQPGFVDAMFLVARWGGQPIYFCVESQGGLKYYLIQRPNLPSLIYFPFDNLLVCQTQAEASQLAAGETLRQLDAHLIGLAGLVIDGESEKPRRLGVFTFGIPHLGHVIWDEMSGLDTFVSELEPSGQPPLLYMAMPSTGIELYGTVEELYPEFAGHVVRAPSEPALIAHAIQAGVELVLISGHRILQSTRARIARSVQTYAEANGLPQSFATIGDRAARERLVITLGLRLTNRCPADLIGLYARLTRTLVRRFGPLLIVIDGMAGPDDPTKMAAPIFNGGRHGVPDHVDVAQDGTTELRAEQEWVDQYVGRVRHDDVVVVSCVGKPIRENLFWVSKSKFFVAPYGAGIAKLRWAFDVPGMVLLSQANRTNFDAESLFLNEETVETPFTPMYFSEVEEVLDLPLDPPRLEPPARVYGIPHPEDFIVNEKILFPRLCSLISNYVEVSRTATAPVSPSWRRSLVGPRWRWPRSRLS